MFTVTTTIPDQFAKIFGLSKWDPKQAQVLQKQHLTSTSSRKVPLAEAGGRTPTAGVTLRLHCLSWSHRASNSSCPRTVWDCLFSGVSGLLDLGLAGKVPYALENNSPPKQAALKCLYLVTRSLDPTGVGRARWTSRWKPALNTFAITFRHR